MRRTFSVSRISLGWACAAGLAAAALLGCSGRTATSPTSPPGAMRDATAVAPADASPSETLATPDAVPVAQAPDAPTFVATPPIDVPGLALWLDGDVNVLTAGNDVVGWKDRSPRGHSFVVEASGVARPRHNRTSGYGTVQFYGHERLVAVEQPNSFTSLTIGDQDFLLALVLSVDSSFQRRSVAFGLLPALPMGPSLPELGPFSLMFEMTPSTASFRIGDARRSWNIPRWPTQGEESRLLILSSVGDGVQIRINGKVEIDDQKGRLIAPANAGRVVIAPNALYVGSWDFDSPGIRGDIGEVVMVIGAGTAAAIAPVEGYLRSKYGF